MKIYSIHYNKPEYIYLQKNLLDKYMKIPFEFIIIDNSVDNNIKDKIRLVTEELNIRRIECYNNIFSMDSRSHQNAFKYIIDDIIEDEVIMILDHDVFIINYLDLSYYDNFDILYLPQFRGDVEYVWPGLVIFNKIKNKENISFKSGYIKGQPCDTGAEMHHYLKNNNLKIKHISENYINYDRLLMSNLDDIFIHLISGSDWNKNYDLKDKLKFIENIIKV